MFDRLRATRGTREPKAEPVPAAVHYSLLRAAEAAGRTEVAEAKAAQEQLKAELLKLSNAVQKHAGEKAEATALLSATMQQQTTRMHEVAERTRTLSLDVCAASQAAVQETRVIASAAERLSGTILEVNSKLSQASDSTQKAVAASDRSKATIGELSEVVSKIGEIVLVIRDIAARTNLLALNATIEAARAGEAGKGFAVVANEVKQLSTQTARSTEDIRQKLEEVIRVTQRSVQTTDEFDQLIREVDSSASAVRSAMQEQSSATDEIVNSVQRALPAVERSATAMESVSREAAEAGTMAAEVKLNAGNVMEELVDLRDVIVGIVRTATANLDRRGPARYAVKCEARIDGDVHAAVVVDNISVSGALITGGAKLVAGGTGRLVIDRKATGFKVVTVSSIEQRIQFTDPIDRDFLQHFHAITENLVPISQGQDLKPRRRGLG